NEPWWVEIENKHGMDPDLWELGRGIGRLQEAMFTVPGYGNCCYGYLCQAEVDPDTGEKLDVDEYPGNRQPSVERFKVKGGGEHPAVIKFRREAAERIEEGLRKFQK